MDLGMKVIVNASQKGGSGKTTLTGHIGIQAHLSGAGPVALVDTDPQGSLAGWWKAREGGEPHFRFCAVDSLDEHLFDLRQQGYRRVFVDTPPAATQAIGNVVRYADLVVIPTRPSPHDLRAVGATVDIVESHRKPMVFVINSATKRARITSDAAVALSQHGTVAPVTVHHRVDFAASMIDGRTVMETAPDSKSTEEIVRLWEYLAERVAKAPPVPLYESVEAQSRGIQAGPVGGDSLRRHAPAFGRRIAG